MTTLVSLLRSHLALFVLWMSLSHGHAQTTVTGIFAGGTLGFYLRSDGTTWATGTGQYCQFGEGEPTGKSVPGQVPISDVVSIANGERFALFLKSNGSVLASGSNDYGQFGDGTTTAQTTPVEVMTGVKAIAAGANHSLFLKTDGSVWTCGSNGFGQLGNGTLNDLSDPVQVLTGVKAISAGRGHSLFLKTDGSVWATGSNLAGQLGDGGTTDRNTPVQVLTGVTAIAAGAEFSLFLMADASVRSCGYNSAGQLGNGTLVNQSTPQQILTGVSAISGGVGHSLFLKTDGTVWAAGFNAEGAIGDGTRVDKLSPVQVFSGVTAISAGNLHSVFLKTDGTVWATGWNISSQLGDGTQMGRTTPGQMFFETRMKEISAGGGHSLFLKGDGSVWATGDNQYGQLGDGTTTSRTTPVQVLSGVKTVSAGRFHSLFVKDDGSAWAVGANTNGQLGNGGTTASSSPVQVLTGVKAVSAGESHSLFLKTDGTVWVCGYNLFGQLGDDTTTDRTTPVQISLTGVKSVSAGSLHSLFLKEDGTVWAAGVNNDGQLGSGPNISSSTKATPVQVFSGARAIDAGTFHSLFLKDDSNGTLYATGSNSSGQLGDGTTNSVFTPKIVFFGVTAVSAGDSHSMFQRISGIWGCGGNFGALANGSTDNQPTPVKTLTGNEQSVSAGLYHSLILLKNGKVFASGRNFTGQIGDGTLEHKTTPVEVTAFWTPEIVVHGPGGLKLTTGTGTTNFGNVNRGANQSITFTVRNAGYQPLTGITPTIVGGNAADFTVSAPQLSEISPEGTTTFSVRFTPSANGARSTTLRIASNDPDQGFFDVPLTGNAVPTPEITVLNGTANLTDGGSVSYGSVTRGSYKTISFTIKNTGIANLSGIAASLSGGAVGDYAITTAPATTLLPNATTTISVELTPKAAGLRATTLRIASNDADENPFDVALSGTGVDAPEITITQGKTDLTDGKSSVSFGTVKSGNTKDITLTLKNTGSIPLTKISAALSKGQAAQFSVTKPAATLAPGKTTTITLTFKPTGTGKRSTTLRIASNDGNEGVFDIILTGTAGSSAKSSIVMETITSSHMPDSGKVTTHLNTDGSRHRVLTVDKTRAAGSIPLVEVSSDLVHWFSGPDYTTVLIDNAKILRVMDRTPCSPAAKRFIRVRWLPPSR